ncbi:hypothetical protein H6G91_19815 [Nostoc muscorum FACHB-395]|nr:hypothetical protein [Desmonostoc muscorum FACHB-395]
MSSDTFALVRGILTYKNKIKAISPEHGRKVLAIALACAEAITSKMSKFPLSLQ